jgi:formyl-CoA transferase
MAALTEHDVPGGPILDMKELIEDQALAESGTVIEVEHPQRGTFKTVGNPIKLSDSGVDVTSPPLLGQHTEEILKAIVGYDEAEIEEARAEGAI